MSKYVRLCRECKSKSNDNSSLRGCGYSTYLQEDEYTCEVCGGTVVDLEMSSMDFGILTEISDEPSFIDAMLQLHDSDIIEYNLKLSQFRTQVEQHRREVKQAKQQSVPHCPNCNSTNIRPISGFNRGASIAMLGIFSKKINKSFECLNCKYTW